MNEPFSSPAPGGVPGSDGLLRVDIYDAPMCCSSGLCGPVLDPVLVAVNDTLLALAKQGVTVARFNPVQQLKEVMANGEVAAAIHHGGKKVLPIVFANGRLVKSGAYPSYEEICDILGIKPLPKARPVTVLTATAAEE